MRAYRYVIVIDAGAAPNYSGSAVTLALCKPKIHKAARPGDLVIAFAGRTLGQEPHAVCWAGIVRERLMFADYWRDRRFASKKPAVCPTPDNIYRPTSKGLQQVPNATHGPASARTDLGGEAVLVFGRAWRFGDPAPVLPARFRLRITNGRRAHRVADLSREQWKELRTWLDVHKTVELGDVDGLSNAKNSCSSLNRASRSRRGRCNGPARPARKGKRRSRRGD